MKKTIFSINAFALMAVLAFAAVAQTPTEKTKQDTKPAKTKTKPAPAPKSDDEIQKCISDKLAASPKLKADNFNVTVAGGVATFAGSTKVAGHKGNASSFAKGCGAKSVQNNISVEKVVKEKAAKTKTMDEKPATTKKP